MANYAPLKAFLRIFDSQKFSMSKRELIEIALNKLQRLPVEKIEEASDFISYIVRKYEGDLLQKGIEKIASEPGAFDFLKEDDDNLYSLDDAIEIYK